ncbi:BTAD domain-containing putative transcriptional regulator [Blastococcus deserti]|uniref:BTAD domain-containing putative transcriptional regulator n=1 Tax=Blastococcus deserti TaxID=2259033 RepID=A0ABW4XBM5_9ACTN
MTVELGILGPLQAVRDGVPLRLGGPRQRAVLARLLVEPRRVVPVDALVEDVWDGAPPVTAAKVVQKYVHQLRRVLGPAVVRTSRRGYSLDLPDHAVDARRFEGLLRAGDPVGALALWRGRPLADVPDLHFAEVERARLAELHTVALERRFEAELRAGRHEMAVPALRQLVEEHPLRERLCGLLMLALYRSGRQVEALQVFAAHRHRLVEETGLDPAAELTRLEEAILRHDPGLHLAASGETFAEGNLRPPVSSFVGREDERRRVLEAVRTTRLVTLTGPGGVGKSRLAAEVGAAAAGDHPAGVWWVDLAALDQPLLVVHRVAATLAVGEQPGQDDEETLLSALEHRGPLLLVLDNCEHLLAACARLADRIIRGCPPVRILATSRRPLGVDGECVVPLPPMPEDDACRLFTDRARLAGTPAEEAAGPAVTGIVRSLDGLPLALELAAAQLRVLGPGGLADRLGERLRFTSRRFDAPARQRTLGDMVAWSHDLLPAPTRRVFARLGVFAGTFALDAAAAVCGEDVLPHVAALVEHSLLAREAAAPTRYRMLDTLRLFALDRLAAEGDAEPARGAHARFYLELAERAGARLWGPEERSWSDRLAAEEPNLHAALGWSAERDHVQALRLAVALWPYWDLTWRGGYALAYFTSALGSADDVVPSEVRAWALTAMADLAAAPGEARDAQRWAGEAVALFRRLGDPAGLGAAQVAVGSALGNEGSLDAAEAALDEAAAIARQSGDLRLAARCWQGRAFVSGRRGQHALSERFAREELAAWTGLGSRRGEATALRHIAAAVRNLGDLAQADHLCNRALGIWHELGDPAAVAHVRSTLADVARQRGDLDRATALYEEAFEELRRIGDRRCTASTYKNLGAVAAARGEWPRSTALLLQAVRLRVELGDAAGLAECFDGIAAALAGTGRWAEAAILQGAAGRRREASGSVPTPEEERDRLRVAGVVEAALPRGRRTELQDQGRRMQLDEVLALVVALAPAG